MKVLIVNEHRISYLPPGYHLPPGSGKLTFEAVTGDPIVGIRVTTYDGETREYSFPPVTPNGSSITFEFEEDSIHLLPEIARVDLIR